jgi:carboxyl-terminal processing protease
MRKAKLATLVISLGVVPVLAGGFALQRRESADAARLFAQVFSHVATDAVDSLSADQMYEKAARGLVRNLNDPYADLYSPKELATFSRNSLGNAYGGVGMQIEEQRIENQSSIFTVNTIFPGTPAASGGVQVGDRIVLVDGWSTAGAHIEEVSGHLTGPPGTSVGVTFARFGVSGPIQAKFTRATVHVPAVPFALMLDGKVGYVPVTRFNETSGQEVEQAVQRLRDRGARSFVLDLRGNGGGSFDESLVMSNLFLPRGADIVTVRYRGQAPQMSRGVRAPVLTDAPLVVLTDGHTASASEIVAGSLQDHDRALVVGTTSFGKGLVQTLWTLDGGWALKMTTGKWYTPSGRSIQRERKLLPDGRLVEVTPDSLETDSVRRARPAFKSDGGRVVYGGGGITPDVIVPADTITTVEQTFARALGPKSQLSYLTLYDFSLELKPKVTPTFKVTPEMRETYYQRLQKAGVTVEHNQFEAAAPLIDRMIENSVARLAFGDSTAFRRSVAYDSQLRRALDLLNKSESQRELLAKAGERGD